MQANYGYGASAPRLVLRGSQVDPIAVQSFRTAFRGLDFVQNLRIGIYKVNFDGDYPTDLPGEFRTALACVAKQLLKEGQDKMEAFSAVCDAMALTTSRIAEDTDEDDSDG
jgi:hypothetical protein